MAFWNTPVFDYSVRLPGNLRKASRGKSTDKTVQQGVAFIGSRKKKNGCKLASSRMVVQGGHATTRKHKIVNHAKAFPPMPL